MNDVDFPVARVLDGHRRRARRRPRAGEGQRGRQARRSTRTAILPMARRFRGTGVILRFIEYMDVGHTNGWRMDDVVPAAEIVATIDAELPARAGRGRLPRRGRAALALPRRQRRDRRHRLGDAAVLRRLHARAPLGRRPALHLPLRSAGPRPARRSCAAARPTKSSRAAIARHLARRAPTATRSSASAETADLPRSRCPSSAAEAFQDRNFRTYPPRPRTGGKPNRHGSV